ncbi:MAG: hypothetical protein LBK83_03690 [Treponema sp.]|nr:hypothetical protein [Treponema sp.]
MTYFSIKYCQKKDGAFVDVTPDIAHYFRVFMITGTGKQWVHDFNMLSKASIFIEKIREAEIKLREAFAAVLAGNQFAQEESIHTVIGNFEQDLIMEQSAMEEEFIRHKEFMEELGRLA